MICTYSRILKLISSIALSKYKEVGGIGRTTNHIESCHIDQILHYSVRVMSAGISQLTNLQFSCIKLASKSA